MARILIFGGHGKVALLLEPLLTTRGDQVTAVIRDAAQVDDVRATGADPVVFDVESASEQEMKTVIAGHDAVVWSAGAGGGSAARTRAVDYEAAVRSMAAAAAVGVSRYVMVSYFGSSPEHGIDPFDSFFAYAEAKAAADEVLRASDLEWTVLAPSRLTLEDPTGRIDAEAESSGSVSRADVARVIAQTLVEPVTIGRTIRFNAGQAPIEEALSPR